MKWNFLCQITAASRTPDYGATALKFPFPLSSTQFVEPPSPRTNFLGTPMHHWKKACHLYFGCQNGDQDNCWAQYTGLFEMIVGVLKTCHTQYTWDSSICIFFCFFLWGYVKDQVYVPPLPASIPDLNVVTCQSIRYVTKTCSVVILNKKMHKPLSQVYFVWQVVNTSTFISNNTVYTNILTDIPHNTQKSPAVTISHL